jgi:hypothetical protein
MNWAIRNRRLTAGVLAVVVGLLTMTVPPDVADFARAAGLLLHGHVGEVYAGAWNQAGPAQLLISWVLTLGGASDGTPWLPVVLAWDVAFVAGAMWLCGSPPGEDSGGPDARRAALRRELVAGLLALLWVAASMPWNGHPAELLEPVLWAYAIVCQRRGRDLAAAGLLALGIAIAPWGILAVPCLLAGAPLLRAVRTGVIAVALGVGSYLPFVLSGHFAMFEYRWGVRGGTIAAMLGATDAGWWLRPVQAAVVALGVAGVAWLMRRSPAAVAAAPMAVGLLRVGTDPVNYSYYWYPVAVASLLLVAVAPRWVLAAGLAYAALLAESANWPLVALALAPAVLIGRSRRPDVVRDEPRLASSPAVQ